MKSYKESGFHDRVSRAAEAKAKALEQFRARPNLSDDAVAARVEQVRRRDAAAAANRAARKATAQAAKDEKSAAAAKRAAIKAPPTEAERKAARDARYAARKKRK